MKTAAPHPTFGRQSEPHTIIIARGEHIRHFQIRPWIAGLCGCLLAAMAVSYLLATTYLVLRDDLIDAASARQARLQQAYEDRISALRTQVDRITSRQVLDQQLVESKVGELLARQSHLAELHDRLGQTLERQGRSALPDAAPLPAQKPELRAALGTDSPTGLAFASTGGTADAIFAPLLRGSTVTGDETTADRADRLFADIRQSLRAIETEQINRINEIAQDAYQTADAIADALEDAGLKVGLDDGRTGIGGPLVALDNPASFEARVRELDEALDLVDRMKSEARRLPIANPSPGHAISSNFGVRTDPLLGTPALHSGMDFRTPMGSDILATAAGTVAAAGWNGGYGRMVEIRHEDGFTTRYAHMSQILVEKGQEVSPGDVIGKSGSSGRSTGPHLHYEVHRHGQALNPIRFLKAGQKIGDYL